MQLKNVIVSDGSFNSADPYKIIYSNITVVNLVLEEGGNYDLLSDESLCSYFVDYYLSQIMNGNFSQFVYNSNWNAAINNIIKEGLAKMGAKEHLAYFEEMSARVEEIGSQKLNEFFNSSYFGENPVRDELKNDKVFEINKHEDLIELNNKWLRNLPNLQVLTTNGMFDEIEKLLNKKIDKE